MNQHPDVLCAGIIVADHVCSPIAHLPAAGELVMADKQLLTIGGCAANTAVDLVKMGISVGLAGRVGNDIFGRIVADMLRELDIDVSGLVVTPGVDTSQTMIIIVAGQDRRFIHTFGANSAFSAKDIPVNRWGRFKTLYLGGYLLMPNLQQEELVSVFAAARQAGAKTVLDVATPGPADYMARLEKLLPHVDAFLPNNHEAEFITGEKDPLKQAEIFHKMGANTAVVTMGGEGAILVNDRVKLRAGVFSVPYVDASGGGDAFDAGFIYGLLHQLDAEDCLRVASALGASCVRSIGTTPGVFTRTECEAFLQEHTLRIERV
ncbi:MAG TPA: carbohydrate kinase family protein [Gemmataceae bacterium]|nr:carbohydrate kinase family protein [Gemmataceae bacterium]